MSYFLLDPIGAPSAKCKKTGEPVYLVEKEWDLFKESKVERYYAKISFEEGCLNLIWVDNSDVEVVLHNRSKSPSEKLLEYVFVAGIYYLVFSVLLAFIGLGEIFAGFFFYLAMLSFAIHLPEERRKWGERWRRFTSR